TAKTFSADRYEIWTMQSGFHNVPKVNGVEQRAGREFKALNASYRTSASAAEFTLELAQAYPKEAGIASWLRTVRLVREKRGFVEIIDRFRLAAPAQDVATTLITPLRPEISGTGTISLRGLPFIRIHYDASKAAAAYEVIPIEDDQLRKVWGGELFRLTFAAKSAVSADTWTLRLERA